ncbi:hypothetical protein [Halarchaeum salinum]
MLNSVAIGEKYELDDIVGDGGAIVEGTATNSYRGVHVGRRS